MSAEKIGAYLKAHHTLTLATSDGRTPHACALFYASDGFTLYFVSETGTRHAQNIALNPDVSAAVHAEVSDWRRIQGVQLAGTCALVEERGAAARALALYTARFPFVAALLGQPAELREAMGKVKFYRLTVRWARWIDNTVGLGYKEEIQLP